MQSEPKFGKVEFETMFREYYSQLCNFSNQFVKDEESAKDICQKVFISLWEKREEMDPKLSIKSYLFTSVRNRSLNYIRDNKKYQSSVLDIECANFAISNDDDVFAVEELQTRINRAMDLLPKKCRQVFELSRFEEKKYREIAEELELSVKTVEAHMSRAMKTLRAELKDYLPLLLLLTAFNIYL